MLISILSIIGTLIIGAMSPGPSFVLVAKKSVSTTRRETLMAILGLNTGALTFAIIALLGLHAVLNAVPMLYTALKLLGGLYLIYLGVQMWRHAKLPLTVTSSANQTGAHRRAYLVGLFTQLSNPKTAIYFASVFAALMPSEPPLYYYYSVAIAAFLVDFCWYTVVMLLLSSPFPRAAYLRQKAWWDRLAGTIMILLGGKLLSMLWDK